MSKAHKSRSGSMQFWPRKRAKRQTARVRSWAPRTDSGLVGFAGYKAGMAHCMVTDNRQHSLTKGSMISMPVTIIECPPLKIFSVRFYQTTPYGIKLSTEIPLKGDKDLAKKISVPKKDLTNNLDTLKLEEYAYIRLMVYTQPRLIGIAKKKPELFEMALGGTIQEQMTFIKEHLGNEIRVEEVFKEGQLVDIHAITKGKGFQGAVKRFGVSLKSHKSEKGQRGIGSLGGWKAQGHFMYRNPLPGQMGYHQRTENNKWLLKIGKDGKEATPAGGLPKYGVLKSDYIFVKGSVAGPAKRLIRLTHPMRPFNGLPDTPPQIKQVVQ